MGNCFGKPKSDNFSSGGQTLGASNPPPKPVTSTPAAKAATYSPTPKGGRTLGATPSEVNSDPRTAAAMAAESRNQPKQAKGKLGKQLDA